MKKELIKTNSYKFRIYPNDSQKVFLNHCFGCSRLVYNLALETKINSYKEFGVSLSQYDIQKQLPELKKEFDWLKDVPSLVYIHALAHMDNAYKKFFKGGGFPKFKSKFDKQSFSIHQGYKLDFENQTLILPKDKTPIKAVFHREVIGTPKTITVSRTKSGKYFLSICSNIDPYSIEPDVTTPDGTIGIDVNIDGFYVSDGRIYETPKPLKKLRKRLAFLQKALSRKKKGSENFRKHKLKIAKLHERITNIRKDWLHKVTDELTNDDLINTICIEDLNVRGMMKRAKPKKDENGNYIENGAKRKSGLSRSLADVAFGEFFRQLTYKCKRRGKNLLKADRFFASSKTCSNCGEKNTGLKLKDRKWTCESCQTEHCRDFNSSTNIKNHCLLKVAP